MRRKIIMLVIAAAATGMLLAGCAPSKSQENEPAATASVLADGVYTAEFKTDSGMFHVNEACDGKGTLTVENGEMTIHVSLVSKNITNLFPGTAEDAREEGAGVLEPTVDSVTYSDGITEEVYGFDIPVPALEEEFELAILGTKGTWYDHKVCVKNPEKTEEGAQAALIDLEDGEYAIEVELTGGTGKTIVTSPAGLTVLDGHAYARIEWSSTHYDYMLVDGKKYLPLYEEGYSTFEIPITVFNEPMEVVADTTAMSVPHEITYQLTFDLEGVMSKSQTPQAAAKRVVGMVILIILVCALVSFINKRKRMG